MWLSTLLDVSKLGAVRLLRARLVLLRVEHRKLGVALRYLAAEVHVLLVGDGRGDLRPLQ